MKLTDQQVARLLREMGPDMWRVDQNLVLQLAQEVGEAQGTAIADKVINDLEMVEEALLHRMNKAGVGGGEVGLDDFDAILDSMLEEDDYAALEMALHEHIRAAITEYLAGLAQAIAHVAGGLHS